MKSWTEGQWHAEGKFGRILPGQEAGHLLGLCLVVIICLFFTSVKAGYEEV